jgi:hypothetical protein
MVRRKSLRHEAEAIFKDAPVLNLASWAQSEREADARAVTDKTAKLKSLRLAKQKTDRDRPSEESLSLNRIKASNDP